MAAGDDVGAVIVVGVDGSPGSCEALEWAAAQARVSGSSLHVVTAWQVPTAWMSYLGATDGVPVAEPDWEETARKELTAAVEETLGADHAGLNVHLVVVEGGGAQVLIDVAQRDRASLLVVGNRGRGGFASLLLGSVSEQCVAHATCPVVVVRK